MGGQMEVSASLRLVRGEKVFGPGIARLLEGVDELGSLRRSAGRMGMSYNKAWHILQHCEAQLGFPLLHRHSGGVGGGGASLTPEGRDMLERYRAFEKEAREALDRLAQKYFGPSL